MSEDAFETDRLLLRPFTAEDEDDLVVLDGDPEVMRFLTGGEPTSRERIRAEVLPVFMRRHESVRGPAFWAAEEKATGEFVGWFELEPRDDRPGEAELGYRLRRSAWGNGYATEGARALVRRGFTELGLRRIFAETMTVNAGSRRVMEKAGLTYVRTFHEDFDHPVDGTEHGEVEYALLRDDWARTR